MVVSGLSDRRLSALGFSLIELVIVLAIVGMLVALTIPAIQAARGMALRTECANHVREIGVALHHYEAEHRVFPPGLVPPGVPLDQMPTSTWLTHLLPYIDQLNLFLQAREAWAAGYYPTYVGGHVGRHTPIKIYQCPADPRSGAPQWTHRNRLVALTSYLGVLGLDYTSADGVLFVGSAIRTSDIRDGLSNTVMVGERPPSPDNWFGFWYSGWGQVHQGVPTGSTDMLLGVRERNSGIRYAEHCSAGPYHYQPGKLSEQCDLFHFWSLHSGGAHFLFADGAVQFLAYSADEILPALATRAGREAVTLP